jgi:hypothetical protein
VDLVPDPLLFFSGSAGNRTRASGSVAKNSNRLHELIWALNGRLCGLAVRVLAADKGGRVRF